MSDSQQLLDCLCCAGDDHRIRDGGAGINIVTLRKLAEWPFMAATNVLVPASKDNPLACAVLCDRCIQANAEPRYAMAGRPGDDGEAVYWRVALDSLNEPEFFWPDDPGLRRATATRCLSDFDKAMLIGWLDRRNDRDLDERMCEWLLRQAPAVHAWDMPDRLRRSVQYVGDLAAEAVCSVLSEFKQQLEDVGERAGTSSTFCVGFLLGYAYHASGEPCGPLLKPADDGNDGTTPGDEHGANGNSSQ